MLSGFPFNPVRVSFLAFGEGKIEVEVSHIIDKGECSHW